VLGYRSLLYLCLVAILVVVPTLLVGCGGDLESSATQPTGAGVANTVTVSGQATVTSPPDEAVVVLTVENDGTTAPEAMDATSIQTQKVLDRLKSEGIEDSAIQTSSITLYPVRTYDPNTGKETLVGYRAQNSVKVTTKDAVTVGKVLTAGVETGVSLVSGPEWRLRDDSQAVNEALKQAVANARAKAETLAAAEGVAIGDVVVMSEGSVQIPVVPVYRYDMAGASEDSKIAPTPVSSGNLDVTATVAVTYELKR
jgi:uncharacterized protein YggE